MKSQLFFLGLIVLALSQTSQQVFENLHKAKNWGEGVSSNLCFNLDYIMRLQHTVDLPDVRKIVEIGYGDWAITGEIYLTDKEYIGYEVVKNLIIEQVPSNVHFKYIRNIKDVAEGGDLLVIKDVLMYLPNDQIEYVMSAIVPKFKYALIQISASDTPHANTPLGTYRPLKMDFNNGRLVILMDYKSTRKETWLIKN